MSKNKLTVTTPTDATILLERTFDAPRALVWRTLSEPQLVQQWWGCGHGVASCEMDFRVGGKWRFVLKMPGDQTVGQSGEYIEIVKPERIVNTESMDGHEGSILVTYTLVEKDHKTLLTCLSDCHVKEVRDIILASGMESGAATGYDRLEEIARSLL